MNMFLSEAIRSICPEAQFTISNDDYSQITWLNIAEEYRPTQEEVEAEMQRLQQEYERNQYQRDRATAYPTIQDQLDLLYHGGLDAWREEINKVKEQYPKPEGL